MLPGVLPSIRLASAPTDATDFTASPSVLSYRNYGRFVQNDALTRYINESICCTQIDRKIVGKHAAQAFEEHETLNPADKNVHE